MPINYKNYPKDWKQRRQRKLKAAGHCCQHCGVKNYSLINRLEGAEYKYVGKYDSFKDAQFAKRRMRRKPEPILIVLTLAHLNHDEWNDKVEDDDLAILCQRCHLQYDRADNQMRKDYGRQYRRFQLELFKDEK